jgi:dTDP-4-amino-4,6-dideoxygalactose transaminase
MQGRKFWHPLHTQAPYKSSDAKFINASRLGPAAFWLPSAFQLSEPDISEVCGAVRAFYSQSSMLAEAA